MAYVAPTELEKHLATISINIPRLRRSKIREFASSINPRRAPYVLGLPTIRSIFSASHERFTIRRRIVFHRACAVQRIVCIYDRRRPLGNKT
jgi:hypothetical protein